MASTSTQARGQSDVPEILLQIVRLAATSKANIEQLNRAGDMDVLMNKTNEQFHQHCYTDEEGMLIDSRTGDSPDVVHLQAFCHRLVEVINSTQLDSARVLENIVTTLPEGPSSDSGPPPTKHDVVLENLISLPPLSALMQVGKPLPLVLSTHVPAAPPPTPPPVLTAFRAGPSPPHLVRQDP